MTIAERNNKLKHFITCLKCEVSGKPCDVNCSTQYDTGNMGEIIENLEAISKTLEQEPILDKIRAEISCNIIEDDTSGNTPARLRANWDAANKAHMIDIAIIDRYKT